MDAARTLGGGVPGIDVIVNGHDNAVLEQPEAVAQSSGGTTLIVSAGAHYRWVGRLRLFVAGDRVTLLDYALHSVDEYSPVVPSVQVAVDALKSGIVLRYGDVYHQQLAWRPRTSSASPTPRRRSGTRRFGNLFTDAYRALTGTDVAFEASGLLRDALREGRLSAQMSFARCPSACLPERSSGPTGS